MKNAIISLLICGLIWYGYRGFSERIYLQHYGLKVEGKLLEKEVHPSFCYLKFFYKVGKTSYVKSLRTQNNRFEENSTIPLLILPEKPDEPKLFLNDESLFGHIEIFCTVMIVYLVYRVTKATIFFTRPNWE